MTNIIWKIVRWALLVGIMGGLVDEVRWMMNKAAHASQHGYISLRALHQATSAHSGGQKKK